VPNGAFYPAEVIEGSAVSLKCDKKFRSEGNWQLTCKNGTLGDNSIEGFPQCVPLRKGLFVVLLVIPGNYRVMPFMNMIQ
jgi:hypothetical protein